MAYGGYYITYRVSRIFWLALPRNYAAAPLTDEFPDMSENDRRLYVLVAYGFSAKSVSLILGIPIENYYNRLSRLRSRLRTSPDGRLLLAPLEM